MISYDMQVYLLGYWIQNHIRYAEQTRALLHRIDTGDDSAAEALREHLATVFEAEHGITDGQVIEDIFSILHD